MRDYEADFSRKQAITATGDSDHILKVPGGDIGKGRPVILQLDADPYEGGGSMEVTLQTDSARDMANPVMLVRYPISAERLAKGGTVLVAAVPTGAKQYLRLNYEVTGTLSGGNITAGLKLQGDTANM